MKAVELKYADGKRTGLWYCGKCRIVPSHDQWNMQKKVKWASEHSREQAEECCTNQAWEFRDCTGCRRSTKACVCGRAKLHCCVACGAKLRNKEGKKIRWGAGKGEICYACQQNKSLAAKLMDARK